MTRFSWLTRTTCLAILLLGIGCGGKTHIVGSLSDGSVGDGSGWKPGAGGTQGSGGLLGQDGPTSLGSGGAATGGTTGGGGAGGTIAKDAAAGTGGNRGTGGATGSGGASLGSGGQTGGSTGSPGTGGAGGTGGTSGSAGSSGDGGLDGGVTECEQRGGDCQSVPLTANAYAWCVSISGSCKLPSSVYEGTLGCAANADGVMAVCCLPQPAQPPSQCSGAGMACYPMIAGLPKDRYEEMCPKGWRISNAICSEQQPGTDCCGPPVRTEPPRPICEPLP
jgi:hypothetical protein